MNLPEGAIAWSRRKALTGLGALTAGVLLLRARPARAHAIVVESTPAVGAEVAATEVDLMIRFNSRVDAERSRLLLERPDGAEVPLDILPSDSADRLDAKVGDLTPGAYTLIWQVLSAEGHITRGSVPFGVVAP